MHPHSLTGDPGACRAGLKRQAWTLDSPSLQPHVPTHSPRKKPKFRSSPLHLIVYKCNQLTAFEGVGGGSGSFRPMLDWRAVPGLGGGSWRTRPLPQLQP